MSADTAYSGSSYMSSIYQTQSGTMALEGCKIYHSDPLSNPDISWTHQYILNNLQSPDESYLDKLKKQTEKSTDLLKSLVRDVRFLRKEPDPKMEVKAQLKDWTPNLKQQTENQGGIQVVFQKDLADDIRSRICNLLKQAGVDISTIDDQQLKDFSDRLEKEMGGKPGCDVFGSDVNHYRFLQTSSELKQTDEKKMADIKKCLDEGCGDTVVLSEQFHLLTTMIPESSLKRFSPVLLDIIPRISRRSREGEISHKVLLENPKTWIACDRN